MYMHGRAHTARCRNREGPGEGAGGGHPSRPARGYEGALQAPYQGGGGATGANAFLMHKTKNVVHVNDFHAVSI